MPSESPDAETLRIFRERFGELEAIAKTLGRPLEQVIQVGLFIVFGNMHTSNQAFMNEDKEHREKARKILDRNYRDLKDGDWWKDQGGGW